MTDDIHVAGPGGQLLPLVEQIGSRSFTQDDFGPWEPAMTEEAITPPIWYCLVRDDETYRFIRRADALSFTIQPGQIVLKYKEYDDVNAIALVHQEVFPIAGNLDIVAELCEESGIEGIDITPLLISQEEK